MPVNSIIKALHEWRASAGASVVGAFVFGSVTKGIRAAAGDIDVAIQTNSSEDALVIVDSLARTVHPVGRVTMGGYGGKATGASKPRSRGLLDVVLLVGTDAASRFRDQLRLHGGEAQSL